VVSLAQLQTAIGQPLEYQCQSNLNLYDSLELDRLATQAVAGRQLRIESAPLIDDRSLDEQAVWVRLCEDDYTGWLPLEDIDLIEVAEAAYQPIVLSEAEICDRLPQVIAFTHRAMTQPNHYLWGGTVGANYDCSGLTQTAFASVGIWIPRDAYQQEAFVQPIALDQAEPDLRPGDLIFFGTPAKAAHVGLHLGDRYYIHSSGKEIGRNGIGIDRLSETGDQISRAYFRQLRGAGRVVQSYQPAPIQT
jgi:cell wall-associated NlpC family hydrolase